jgi:hypothetical protein
MIEPQRHRDTEKAQSHPPIPICPQITQMTQILFGSGLRKPARSMSSCHPLVLYRRGAEAQRRRESTRIQRVARSWSPNGGQEPLERAPVPIASDRQIAVCSTVNLRHCRITSATTSLRLCAFAPLRSFRWVEKFPETFPRLHLRDLRDLWANWDGPGFAAERLRRGKRAARCLCGSAPLRLCVLCSVFLLCVSVPLWFFPCLGGSPGRVATQNPALSWDGGMENPKSEIRNPKSTLS